ncbi:HigA family addiction module antitoxin [Leptospira sp. WS60.C2]
MKLLANIHPGQILSEEFLTPLNITAYRLAKETGIPQTRISQILQYKRSISADTAIRLSKFFGTTPQFWLGLQNDYDLEEEMLKKKKEFNEIHNYKDLAIAS